MSKRCALLLLPALALPAAGATPEEACEIAKNKAAGAYAACRQQAEANAIQKATTPTYGKCDDRFTRSWNRAEAKAAKRGAVCVDGLASGEVRQLLADRSDVVAGLLAGTSARCLEPYRILDRESRNVSKMFAPLCDDDSANTGPQWQGTGWYRFREPAGTRMPESPPEPGSCSTTAPGWLNGAHPEVEEGVVARSVCFSFGGDPCGGGELPAEVVNCGGFYLYNLRATGACDLRYCAE